MPLEHCEAHSDVCNAAIYWSDQILHQFSGVIVLLKARRLTSLQTEKWKQHDLTGVKHLVQVDDHLVTKCMGDTTI